MVSSLARNRANFFLAGIFLSVGLASTPRAIAADEHCAEDSSTSKSNLSFRNELVSLQKVLGTTSETSCQLALGEQIILNSTNSESPTGVDRHYRLTRTSAKNFLVELRLEFSIDEKKPASSSQEMSLEPPKLAKQESSTGSEKSGSQFASELASGKDDKDLVVSMARQVEECLTENNEYFKNSDGSSFTIKLNQADIRVPLTQIGITSETRSSSKLYFSNIDCPSIAHEILHLLGLNDEYRERSNGFFTEPGTGEVTQNDLMNKFMYDCRSIGPVDSIMRDQHKAFKLRAEKKTLLYPAQFRVITQPNCFSSNKTYFSCSANARRTSTQNGGAGCAASPSICSKEGAEWLK